MESISTLEDVNNFKEMHIVKVARNENMFNIAKISYSFERGSLLLFRNYRLLGTRLQRYTINGDRQTPFPKIFI